MVVGYVFFHLISSLSNKMKTQTYATLSEQIQNPLS